MYLSFFHHQGTRCNGSMLGITTHAEVAVVNLPKDQLLGKNVRPIPPTHHPLTCTSGIHY